MKYSKKVRAEAILILDIMTSHLWLTPSYVSRFLEADDTSERLASAAWHEVPGWDVQSCGDAAGLLRDGWCPGEGTVRL